MATQQRTFTRVAVAVVVAVVVIAAAIITGLPARSTTTVTKILPQASISSVTTTLTRTTTVFNGVKVVGTCTAVGWVQADSLVYSNTTITEVSGNATSYAVEQTSGEPPPYSTGSTSYTTTSYGNMTGYFTVISTTLTPGSGAGLWTVTTCYFES